MSNSISSDTLDPQATTQRSSSLSTTQLESKLVPRPLPVAQPGLGDDVCAAEWISTVQSGSSDARDESNSRKTENERARPMGERSLKCASKTKSQSRGAQTGAQDSTLKANPNSGVKEMYTRNPRIALIFRGMKVVVTGMTSCKDITGEELEALVKHRGATLLSSLEHYQAPRPRLRRSAQSSMTQLPKTVLLSDKPYRTQKYLLALVLGIPCLHYSWAIRCCDEVLDCLDCILSRMALPA